MCGTDTVEVQGGFDMTGEEGAGRREQNSQRSPAENPTRVRLDTGKSEEGYGPWMLVRDKRKNVRSQTMWREKTSQGMQGGRMHGTQLDGKGMEVWPGTNKENMAFSSSAGPRKNVSKMGCCPTRPTSTEGRAVRESPGGDCSEKAPPKPTVIIQILTNDQRPTHPSTHSTHLNTEPLPNPSTRLEEKRVDGGRKGVSKIGNQGLDSRGVGAGRIAKVKDQKIRKQIKVKVAGATKSMQGRGGDGTREFGRRAASKEGKIVIDLTQVSAKTSTAFNLSDAGEGLQGAQLMEVYEESEGIGDEGEKAEASMETAQKGHTSQRTKLLDPGDKTMNGSPQAQFQFISYDEQQVIPRKNDDECRSIEGEGCESRDNTSMLVEWDSSREEGGPEAREG